MNPSSCIFIKHQTLNMMKKSNSKLSLITMGLMLSILCFSQCTLEGIDDLATNHLAISEDMSIDLKNENFRKADQNQLLAEMRKRTAKYHRLEVAEEDGYALIMHCVAHPEEGGMGYHAPNFLLVDGEYDIFNPEVMVYESTPDGKMKLVAIEYVVMADLWAEENPPMFGDIPFDFVPANPMGLPFDNYQLHVWIWKHNPSGMYAPFNPNVSCP